jgi:hypothetical protein
MMEFVSAFMQQLSALENSSPEELLTCALQICSQNDELLASRLSRIMGLSSWSTSVSRVVEPLECALRIFCYIRDTHKSSDLIAGDRLNACIEEISRAIATSLVKGSTSSNSVA